MQEIQITIDREILNEVEELLPDIMTFLFDKSVNFSSVAFILQSIRNGIDQAEEHFEAQEIEN